MRSGRLTRKTVFGFIIGLCLLLCAVCVPFYQIRKLGYQLKDVQHKTDLIENEKENTIDAVFLGDSAAWSAFSPLQLYNDYGFASYNGATPGQWTEDSLIVLKKILEKQKPSILVMGTSTLYSDPNPLKYWLSQVLPVFHYHNWYKVKKKKYGDENTKGANLSTKVVPYEGSTDYMSSVKEIVNFSSNTQKYLDQIEELCQENQIKLIMVSTPAPRWNNGKHLAVEQWCTQNNVAYIDYNEEDEMENLSFDWSSDTRDGGEHVNLSGSIKLTAAIGQELDRCGLKDHRGDTKYAEWGTLYLSCKLYK